MPNALANFVQRAYQNEEYIVSLGQPAGIQAARGLLRLAVDVIYPPRCPSCQAYVTAAGNFCTECFQKLRMIEAPMCACCGIPFVIAVEENTRCPECLDVPPAFDMARAAMVYDAVSAPLVSALKFHDQWAYLARYVALMLRAGKPVLEGADLLVPVPLHWRRLLRRKFNQSALLAYGLAGETGIVCTPELLQRTVYTKPQMRMTRQERLKNVKHAFAVPEAAEKMLRNKMVVLVDDVVTTGATANACATALKRAGAKEVRVLALARTMKE
jgi:ComF family protein